MYCSPNRTPSSNELLDATRIWRWPLFLFVFSSAFYCTYYLLAQLHPEAVETCTLNPYQRELNPDSPNYTGGGSLFSRGVRNFLFFFVVRAIFVFVGILLLLYSQHKIGIGLSLLLSTGAYFVGLSIAEEMKHRSGDFECHTVHPNGVSGHAYYSAWVIWLFYYFMSVLQRNILRNKQLDTQRPTWQKKWTTKTVNLQYYSLGNSNTNGLSESEYTVSVNRTKRRKQRRPIKHEKGLKQMLIDSMRQLITVYRTNTNGEKQLQPLLLHGLGALIWCCVGVQLIYTFCYGYHSLRQMFLGASFGGLYASVVILLIESILLLELKLLQVTDNAVHQNRTDTSRLKSS